MAKRRFDWATLRRPAAPASRHAPPAADAVGGEAIAATPVAATGGPAIAPGVTPPVVAGIDLRVNDLKQFAYCPRIVFYHYTLPVDRRATFKMKHGKQIELRLEKLEKRRKLREYGLANGARHFQVAMRSARLGLSGRIDLLIETRRALFPVDFKDTTAPVRHNHHVQLCAYALLIEDTYHRMVTKGFIYRVPRNDIVAVAMSPDLRAETMQVLHDIRTLIRTEHVPAPTPVRARCTDCEYRNYCADVF